MYQMRARQLQGDENLALARFRQLSQGGTAVVRILAILAFATVSQVTAEYHWAFEAPERPELPHGEAPNPIDRFLSARFVAENIKPAPRAAKHTLIRRLSFDLRGLPPTPEEVAAFTADNSPDAWSNLVERFLASPHFGERMAQNWLDLARFADTSGYAADRTRLVCWRSTRR